VGKIFFFFHDTSPQGHEGVPGVPYESLPKYEDLGSESIDRENGEEH
jgi:hypothetical protein